MVNFCLFNLVETEIFFLTTETSKKAKEVQVACLLNLIRADTRKIYHLVVKKIVDVRVANVPKALEKLSIKNQFGNESVKI